MPGRLTYFSLGKGQNPVYCFFKQAHNVAVLELIYLAQKLLIAIF
jgi:hypothetical protein